MSMQHLDLIVRIGIVCTFGGLAILIAPLFAAVLGDAIRDIHAALKLQQVNAVNKVTNKHTNNQRKELTPWQLKQILM